MEGTHIAKPREHGDDCCKCSFYEEDCSKQKCNANEREDGRDVYFVMNPDYNKINWSKIQIPTLATYQNYYVNQEARRRYTLAEEDI